MVWRVEVTCGIMDKRSVADECAGGVRTREETAEAAGAADGKPFVD